MDQQIEHMSIDIGSYRPEGATSWDLPSWGHPLSQGIFPLFAVVNDRLFPIGTAFSTGRTPTLLVSARHNILDAIYRYERDSDRILRSPKLPLDLTLKDVGFAVLYNLLVENGNREIRIWPLDGISLGETNDLALCVPRSALGTPYISAKFTFDTPRIGAKVWSIGFCDVSYPKEGIPLGEFDLDKEYSHRFHIVEGAVQNLFVHSFFPSPGPSFTINAEIEHGQSGGPVLTPDGYVCGVNCAGVTAPIDGTNGVLSLVYPLLNMEFGFSTNIGGVNLNRRQRFIDAIVEGKVLTDGSETRIPFSSSQEGSRQVNLLIHRDDWDFAYNDRPGLESNTGPTEVTSTIYFLGKENKTSEPIETEAEKVTSAEDGEQAKQPADDAVEDLGEPTPAKPRCGAPNKALAAGSKRRSSKRPATSAKKK